MSDPTRPRHRLRVTTRPLAGEPETAIPAETVPEMQAAPERERLWPRIVSWCRRGSLYVGAVTAVLGGVYAVSRITVAAERKEADQAETTTLVRSMSERLAKIEGRLEVIINMVRPTSKKESAE